MATYIIVDKDKDPLAPGEINAGTTIQVSDGDVFIVDSTANDNITFVASGGIPADFDVQINDTNTNSIDLNIKSNLTPTVTVADNVEVSEFKIDAGETDAINFTAGDNVSFGSYDGSENGTDTITIGNGFTTTEGWNTSGGDDDITVGNNATFEEFETGDGADTLTFGDGATVDEIDTGDGADTLTFGDGATVDEIDTGDGADTIVIGDDLNADELFTGDGDDDVTIGANATVGILDGEDGTDTLTTQTPGLDGQNFETENAVCYAYGTLINTPDGLCAVETLRPGDMVMTLDNGPQQILWFHLDHQPLEEVAQDSKPVLITAGALGNGIPNHDLIVSPQHRIFVGGHGQLQNLFRSQAFAPAKSLTSLRGIRQMQGKRKVTWVHFACARHEVVFANGCLSESLLLGPMVVKALTNVQHGALTDIFGPPTPGSALNGPPARDCLTVDAVQRQLKENQHIANEIKKNYLNLAMEQS